MVTQNSLEDILYGVWNQDGIDITYLLLIMVCLEPIWNEYAMRKDIKKDQCDLLDVTRRSYLQ